MSKNLYLILLFILSFTLLHAQTFNNTLKDHAQDSMADNPFPFYSFTSFSRLLNGIFPGVQVTHSGQPGIEGAIMIRGPHSIEEGQDPLLVLDGAPYFGQLSSIHLQDIESIRVIKNAEAYMTYGLRGARGVIEIITKKAKEPGWHFSVDAKTGITNRAYPDYEVLDNSKDYYETYWEAYRNALVSQGYTTDLAGQIASGLHPGEAPGVIDYLGGYNAYHIADSLLIDPITGKLDTDARPKYRDNWSKELQRTGLRQDYHFSAGRAETRGNLYFSGGYLNDAGYVRKTGFERYNARLHGNLTITPWMKAGLNFSAAGATMQRTDEAKGNNPFFVSRNIAPIYPAYYLNADNQTETDPRTGTDKLDWGSIADAPESSIGTRPFYPGYNALGSLMLDKNQIKTRDIVAVPYVEATFLKHFTARSRFFYNHSQVEALHKGNQYYTAPGSVQRYASSNLNRNSNYTWDQVLSWARSFPHHKLSIRTGHETFRSTLFTETIGQSNAGGGSPVPGGIFQERMLLKAESYYGRLDYVFRDRYLISGGIRSDKFGAPLGTSRPLSSWSATVAWMAHKALLNDRKYVDLLKFRLNYGVAGGYGLAGSEAPVSNLEAGVDFSLFGNRLSGTVDYYIRNASEMVLTVPVPRFIPRKVVPIGVSTKGIDFNLNLVLADKKNFSWNAGLNLGHYRNRIYQMPQGYDTLNTGLYQLYEGGSIYDFYLVEHAGVDPENGNELYYYTDKTGRRSDTASYMYAQQSRILCGSALPDLFGGLTNLFRYHNIELAFRLSFALGGKYYDQIYEQLMKGGSGAGQNWSRDILNRWTPENRQTDVPRLDAGNANISASSNRFLTTAAYLSISQVMLSYHFDRQWIRRVGAGELSMYISVNNLALFAAGKGMDPQATFSGNPGYVYAPARTMMLGVHVGL